MSLIFKRAIWLAPVAVAAATLFAALPATAGVPDPQAQTTEQRLAGPRVEWTDQIIVKYRKGSAAHARASLQTMATAHAVLNQSGAQMRHLRRNGAEAHVMKLDRRLALDHLAHVARAIALADPEVEYAEPDRMMHALFTPNDSLFGSQWHYYEATGGLNAPAAWDQTSGSGIVVAVLDTGRMPTWPRISCPATT